MQWSFYAIQGRSIPVALKRALFIPTYPQDFMSVKTITADGAQVVFGEGQNRLFTKEGNVFKIEEHERLNYLQTVTDHKLCDDSVNDMMSKDKVKLCCDVKTWHEILGHCNVNDVLKLLNIVTDMTVTGEANIECNVCTPGKLTNTRNK